MSNPEFLNWLADRLVHLYGESDNVDFVLKLRELAKSPKIEAGDIIYNRAESNELRDELIKLRNDALVNGDFNTAVRLSHTVAWMYRAMEILWPEK